MKGKQGNAREKGQAFDLVTFREKSLLGASDDSGKILRLACDARHYAPSEMTWLLRSAGFKTADIFGARLGAFSLKEALTPDDFEMLVIASR